MTKHVIGEKIIGVGTLTLESAFVGYTHTFINEKGETFGAKSSTLALQQYSGSVQIKGEIVDIKDGLPIVRIDELFPTRAVQEPLDASTHPFYYFPAQGFGIDLSISQ